MELFKSFRAIWSRLELFEAIWSHLVCRETRDSPETVQRQSRDSPETALRQPWEINHISIVSIFKGRQQQKPSDYRASPDFGFIGWNWEIWRWAMRVHSCCRCTSPPVTGTRQRRTGVLLQPSSRRDQLNRRAEGLLSLTLMHRSLDRLHRWGGLKSCYKL